MAEGLCWPAQALASFCRIFFLHSEIHPAILGWSNHGESQGYALKCFVVNSRDFGVPQNRRRVYIVMIREDSTLHGGLLALAKIKETLRAVQVSPLEFTEFLEDKDPLKPMKPTKPLELTTTCTCDIFKGCAVHGCFCRNCCGQAKLKACNCGWRRDLLKYMSTPRIRTKAKKYLNNWRKVRKDPTLQRVPTYFMLAKKKGLDLSRVLVTQRERATALAISRTMNLLSPVVVYDAMRNVDHFALRRDGLIPTLTTQCSKIFVPFAGRHLSSTQCFWLQGFDVDNLSFAGVSIPERFFLAGNAMTCTVVGSIMAATLEQQAV